MNYLSLYAEFIKIRVQSQIEDRGSFVLTTAAKAAGFTAEALVIWVMIAQFKTIGSWSSYEVMLLFALNLTTYSIAAFFLFHPFTKLPSRIQSGEFDELLTKPINPLIYLICREVSTGYFANLIVSLSVGVISIIKLKIHMTPMDIIFLLAAVLGGALIQGAIFIFAFAPSFWLIQNNAFSRILFELRSFVRYPISIYSKGIQVFLTVVVPYAFINFYPAYYLLKKNDFTTFNPLFQYLTLPIGVIVFIAAYAFWKSAINHYKSTGS